MPPQRYYSLKKIAILVLILQKEDDKLEQKTRIMHNVSVGVVDLKKKRKKEKKGARKEIRCKKLHKWTGGEKERWKNKLTNERSRGRHDSNGGGDYCEGKCILKENKVKMVSGDQGSASIL